MGEAVGKIVPIHKGAPIEQKGGFAGIWSARTLPAVLDLDGSRLSNTPRIAASGQTITFLLTTALMVDRAGDCDSIR
jgi:hypothetical protein